MLAILGFYNSVSLLHPGPPNLVRKLDLGGLVVTNNQHPPAGWNHGARMAAILGFHNSASHFHSVSPNLVRKLNLDGPVVTNNHHPPAGWSHGGRMPAQSMMTFRAPDRPVAAAVSTWVLHKVLSHRRIIKKSKWKFKMVFP